MTPDSTTGSGRASRTDPDDRPARSSGQGVPDGDCGSQPSAAGGTGSTASKYVVETGPGFETVLRVSSSGSVKIGLETLSVDWVASDDVSAIEADIDRAIVLTARPHSDALVTYPVGGGEGPVSLSIAAGVLECLGVAHGDYIRLYQRDAESLVVVPKTNDPFVDGDLDPARVGLDSPGDAVADRHDRDSWTQYS